MRKTGTQENQSDSNLLQISAIKASVNDEIYFKHSLKSHRVTQTGENHSTVDFGDRKRSAFDLNRLGGEFSVISVIRNADFNLNKEPNEDKVDRTNI